MFFMHVKKIFSLLSVFLSCIGSISAQELYAINAAWSDSFTEWKFITADEEEGDFGLRWLSGDDWTEWKFDMEGQSGTFQMKWADDPNSWELRSGGEVINIRTKWKNDFSEWRLSDGTIQISFRSKYTNDINEWSILDNRYGDFYLQTEWENDPRDWHIYDETKQSISFEMKLAMTFIAIINSIPKV